MRIGLYEPLKNILGAEHPETGKPWKKFLAGALAGMIGSAVANPTDLLKIRMMAQPPGEF